ncbi:hypothetical protein O3P69_013554, partial [Scylla paramamosain]
QRREQDQRRPSNRRTQPSATARRHQQPLHTAISHSTPPLAAAAQEDIATHLASPNIITRTNHHRTR